MIWEFLLAFGVITLSLAGLGIGLFLDGAPPSGSCATAMASSRDICPVCGQNGGAKDKRP